MRVVLYGCIAALIAASPCTAAVFERDWKAPGDGLLTFDDVNNREWLDLSVSRLEQFSGSTLEQRYQSVVAELAPGGQLEGFHVANRGDVIAFAQSAGIDTSTDDFAINQEPVTRVINLLGPTVSFPSGAVISTGFIDELHILTHDRQAATFYFDPGDAVFKSHAQLVFSRFDLVTPVMGVMLLRVVPEPPSVVLSLVAISILSHGVGIRPRTSH